MPCSTGNSVPDGCVVMAMKPLAAAPAGAASSSELLQILPMIRSAGKPTFCAVFSATGFITPQPRRMTQSGLIRRMFSHCDCCSLPGCGTSSSVSSKPYLSARVCSTSLVSLP
ncbi:hypothetical protein D3C77_650220 [compost metagenome]